jgi:HPt (histidine-containing phosphotransfer) domain-containing protein
MVLFKGRGALPITGVRGTSHMTDNTADGFAIIDAAKLEVLANDTGLGIPGIAALFAEQMAYQLIDLQAALEGASEPALVEIAHRCVGSSAAGGMEQLTHLLRWIEQHPAKALEDPDAASADVERAFNAVLGELARLAEGFGLADAAVTSHG